MGADLETVESLVGSVLEGAYRVVRLVGRGGMGAVYEALQLRLSKRVAVKVMARELAANAEALARFRREAEVTSAIGHPHIVQVFDFSATPTGEPFLVMEFLEGEDLDHRIRTRGCLSPPQTLHIVKQVASALAATHSKGIVHRDLKPANVFLLDAAGELDFVKVLDFGISKVRSAATKLTQSAAVMGTPNYMSPEQALGQVDDIDHRTDQWALACIAWEALSGEGPFVGESIPSLLFQVVHESPPPLTPKVPGLRPQVEQVLRRALSKNKAERYPTVTSFTVALECAVNDSFSALNTTPPPMLPTAILDAGYQTAPGDTMVARSSLDAPQPLPTTLSQTAGQMERSLEFAHSGSKRTWAIVGGTAIALIFAAFLLLRNGPTAKPMSAGRSHPTSPRPRPEPTPPPAAPAPVEPAPLPTPLPPAPTPVAPAERPTFENGQLAASPSRIPGKKDSRRKPRAGVHSEAPPAEDAVRSPKSISGGPSTGASKW